MNNQRARKWVQTVVADAKELPHLLTKRTQRNVPWQQDFTSLLS